MTSLPLIITPDPDEPECAEVQVEVELLGSRRLALLDSGAARSATTLDVSALGLEAGSSRRTAGAFGQAVAERRAVPVPEYALGPLVIRDLDVDLVDAAQPGARDLVGMDVLIHACCRYRFGAAELILEDSPAADATLPLALAESGHSYVELTWPRIAPDARATACWDSGAGMTVVDRAFFAAHRELFSAGADGTKTTGTDATGASAETPTFTMAGATIGGLAFAAHVVAIIDLGPVNAQAEQPMDLILGYPTLRQADWLFDYPARTWSLAPAVH